MEEQKSETAGPQGITVEIKHRYTGAVLFTTQVAAECIDHRRAAVEAAYKAGVPLDYADLVGVDLSWLDLPLANLRDANLRAANLRAANLRAANLRAANLRAANLSDANLRDANLSDANLSDANLSDANLDHIKNDVWAVLLHAIPEVHALETALVGGRVDGSVYRRRDDGGFCGCLVGTLEIAHAERTGETEQLDDDTRALVPGLVRNSYRPAEVWFLGIHLGHTPESSTVVKLTVEWVREFQRLVAAAAPIAPIAPAPVEAAVTPEVAS